MSDQADLSQSDRRWLYLIIGLALLLRIGFVFWLQNYLDSSGKLYLIEGDAAGYWDLAKTIVEGNDYAIHQPPRYVHRMPGVPSLLAVSISLFGESRFAARLLMATLGGLSCGLVFLLGKRLYSSKAGFIAAFLFAVSPAAIGFSGLILSETAFGVMLLLSLLAMDSLIKKFQSPNVSTSHIAWSAAKVGSVVALGVYMKPSWILIAPLFGLILVLAYRPVWRSISAATMIMLSMVLFLLPWGIRNYQVSGHFKLTTFWMGPSLYDGLNPGATGESDMSFFDADQLSSNLSEFEVDQEYQQRAISFAKTNPGKVVKLAGKKLWRFWKPWPNAQQFDRLIIRLGLSLFTIPVFLLAIWGAWCIWDEIWPVVICILPVFYFSDLHMIFVSSLRYRLPAEPPLMVLAAIGILSFVSSLKEHHKAMTAD